MYSRSDIARAAGLIACVGLVACSQSPSARLGADDPHRSGLARPGSAPSQRLWAAGAATGAIARLEIPERPEPAWTGTTPMAAPTSPPGSGEQLETPRPGAPAEPRTPPRPQPGKQSRKPRLVELGPQFPKGSIVVVNEERALYLVGEGMGGKSIRYPVAIGAPEEMWTGVEFVADKRTNPTWHPVAADGTPAGAPVPGGDPGNPLGKHALYLGRTLWRIHGTIAPGLIGAAASNGCIRMHNEHIAEIYARVHLGTEVYVVDSLQGPLPRHRGRKIAQVTSG